jgi:CNT family concentrative nucleoside transporter
MSELRGAVGLVVIIGVAILASNQRSRIPWRTVAVGLFAQVAFAVLVLRWSVGKDALDFVAGQVEALIHYTDAGIEFLFGRLVAERASQQQSTIFALQVLPVIIFIGALVGLLFYLRVIQWIVEIVGGAIAWAMRTTKVESLYAATVIFLGQSPHALGAVRRDDRGLRLGGRLDAGRLRAAGRAAPVPARRDGHERPGRALHGEDHVPGDRAARERGGRP